MKLEELIDVARIAGFLTNDCWKKAHKVRNNRNDLIHPDKYSKIVNSEPTMQQLAKNIKISSNYNQPGDMPRIEELKKDIAFIFSQPKFAKETYIAKSHKLCCIFLRNFLQRLFLLLLRHGND